MKKTNIWDSKILLKKQSPQNLAALGMAPAENKNETFWCQFFTQKINLKFKKNKTTVVSIHHTEIDDKGLKTPDVSFWKTKNNYPTTPFVVIEVDKKRSQSLAVRKAKDAIANYNIKEAFVYLIDIDKWRKFYMYNNKIIELNTDSSFSTKLNIDLSKI